MPPENQQLEWHVEKRNLADLKNWEENPRTISPEGMAKLKEKILARGFHDVLKVDLDNTVLSGNQRLKVLLEIGIKEVDCKVPNRILTTEERSKVALESNIEEGIWDYGQLANFHEDILFDVGFTQPQLDNIFGLERTDDFDIDKEIEALLAGEAMRTAPGQLWQLGDHKLLIGDATDRKNWEQIMGEEKFDFMLTDPPYLLKYAAIRKVPKRVVDLEKDKTESI